ncbi:MAG: hypothetical protein WAM30_04130 [Candidatus Dormiibacterota bacterium]
MARWFLVEFANGPAWDAQRGRRQQAGWDEHAPFVDALVADGFVVLAGPVGEGEGDGAVLVVEADSDAAVRARFADDPWLGTILELTSVRPWSIWARGPGGLPPAEGRSGDGGR